MVPNTPNLPPLHYHRDWEVLVLVILVLVNLGSIATFKLLFSNLTNQFLDDKGGRKKSEYTIRFCKYSNWCSVAVLCALN